MGLSVSQTYCGDFVAYLCPNTPEGCPDGAGDYDVVFPEPLGGVTSDGYVVRVEDAGNSDDAACSDEFSLIASSEAPQEGEIDGPTLEVLLPIMEDEVIAGQEYTVKVCVSRHVPQDDGTESLLLRYTCSTNKFFC